MPVQRTVKRPIKMDRSKAFSRSLISDGMYNIKKKMRKTQNFKKYSKAAPKEITTISSAMDVRNSKRDSIKYTTLTPAAQYVQKRIIITANTPRPL